MRVVAGKYGGRPLKTLDSETTGLRLIKVKGAIFNMIGPYFDGGRVLAIFILVGVCTWGYFARYGGCLESRGIARAQAIIQNISQMTKGAGTF